MKADDCICHYLPFVLIGLPLLITGIVFGMRKIKAMRQARRERLERERIEKEKRILESTRFMYRSAPSKEVF